MELLKPDYLVSSYDVLDPDWLRKLNISYVFSDLDNTLIAHGEAENEHVNAWIKKLEKAGISFIGTSNNNNKRAQLFRDTHSVIVIDNSRKPRTKVLKQYLSDQKIDVEDAVFIGDQIFVDVICGKRLNMTTVLVKPVDKNTPLTVKLTWLMDYLSMKLFRLR